MSRQVKPLDIACASLVLFSLVKLVVVSASINQSSNCDELLPLKIVISCSSVFAKVVFFYGVHKVFVYCCSTSSRGSGGAEG